MTTPSGSKKLMEKTRNSNPKCDSILLETAKKYKWFQVTEIIVEIHLEIEISLETTRSSIIAAARIRIVTWHEAYDNDVDKSCKRAYFLAQEIFMALEGVILKP